MGYRLNAECWRFRLCVSVDNSSDMSARYLAIGSGCDRFLPCCSLLFGCKRSEWFSLLYVLRQLPDRGILKVFHHVGGTY